MAVQKLSDSLDWNDLRYALELARHGSLSAAARILKVNHATVARRIGALEASLGITLFDRGPRGYRPTPAAAPVLEAAEQVELPLLRLSRLAEAQRGEQIEGLVRITATEGVASYILAPLLPQLRSNWPLLDVEIVVEHRSLSLARREAEIAFRWAKPEAGDIYATKLGKVPYHLYRHPLAVESDAVAGFDETLAELPESRWLAAQADLRPVLRGNSFLPLIAAARAGACAILLPDYVGSQLPELVPDPGEPPVVRELWLLVHGDLRRAPRVRTAADFFIQAIKEILLRDAG